MKNTGTEAASVAAFTASSPAFTVKWAAQPGAFIVPPGGSSSFTVALAPSSVDDGAALAGTIKPNTTKVLRTAAHPQRERDGASRRT